MIDVIYYTLFSIALVYGMFFLLTSLFIFIKDKHPIVEHKAKTKFAIIIAARNEENVIKDLIDSLKNQNYPEKLMDIYTVINNCTDNTLSIAKKAGSKIIEVDVPVSCKGQVLEFAFEKLEKTNYDAYIIFDADNVVHPDFVKKMNDIYQSGFKVAQGRKDSKNIEDNWISASYTLYYYIQNYFYNVSRKKLNAASAISGTGFMAEKKLIDEIFEPKTITEDIELSLMSTLNGVPVAYVDDAITYDEQPTDFLVSWHQRIRWSVGIMQCSRFYSGKLFKHFLKHGDFASLDKFLLIQSPYFQVLSMLLLFMLMIFKLVGYNLYDVFSYMFNSGIVFFIISYILGVLINIFVIKVYKQKVKETLHGILLFTVFIFTWIPINIICIFKKDAKWIPVKHDKNVEINRLVK